MKTLIVLSALPGAGKSTYSEQFRRTHKNVFVVSSDEIRKELTGEYQNFAMEKEVWETYLNRLNEYAKKELDDLTVIADATNPTNYFRKYYFENTYGYDEKILVTIFKPWELLLKQNMMRNEKKIVPLYAMEKLRAEWENPNQEIIELYDQYLRINRWFSSDKVPQKFYYKD